MKNKENQTNFFVIVIVKNFNIKTFSLKGFKNWKHSFKIINLINFYKLVNNTYPFIILISLCIKLVIVILNFNFELLSLRLKRNNKKS